MFSYMTKKMSQASHTFHEFITHTLWSSLHKNGNNTPTMNTMPNIIIASTSDGKHIIIIAHDLQKQGHDILPHLEEPSLTYQSD